jgi:putative ABC transport system permease protein
MGDIQINVVTNQNIGDERIFISLNSSKDSIWEEMLDKKILIAEPLANRLQIDVGSQLAIQTPSGEVAFEVLGIFTDYTSSQGYIMIPRDVFETYWKNDGITALSIVLKPETDVENAVREMKTLAGNFDQQLMIRSNQSLRNDVMAVFDRTFAITNSLRFIATLVSFIGILSATLIILIDRRREFGVLKAIGMRGKELSQLLIVETGMMGILAGLFAIPTGIIISMILVYVINLRSFGWTIQFAVDFWSLLQGVLIAIFAALLATIYPLRQLHRLKPIQVIRNE